MRIGILLMLIGTGCAAGARVGAGPTVDTMGGAGASVVAGGHIGVANAHGGMGVVMTLEGFAGAQGNPGAFVPGIASGFDVVRVSSNDEVLFRVGPRLRARWLVADGSSQQNVGAELVAGGTFGALREHHLGLELRVGVLSDSGEFDGGRPVGTFSLNLVWDIFRVEDLL